MPRFRIKTLLILTAIVGVGLSAWFQWRLFIDDFCLAIPVDEFAALDALGLTPVPPGPERENRWLSFRPQGVANYGYAGAESPRILLPPPLIATILLFAATCLWLLRNPAKSPVPKRALSQYTK